MNTSSQPFTLSDELVEKIRSAVKELKNKDDVVRTIVNTLIESDVDLRYVPSLEEMKQILTDANNSFSCESKTVLPANPHIDQVAADR